MAASAAAAKISSAELMPAEKELDKYVTVIVV
jgi:hypothetical protein